MTQIPLMSGVTASEQADFNVSLPINLEGVPVESGISQGYLRSAMGATTYTTGPGIDRGGILWNNQLYRVMGTKLVSVTQAGAVSTLGDVGGTGPVSLTYGFDRLAIQSGTKLYYWNGSTLVQVTDPDLGPCLDVLWMAGYFVSTDGTSIVVTQLSDPTAVDPLKYGSAEADPDMVTGLLSLRNELIALGQNTIEFFDNQGGSGFPFVNSPGAMIPIGCVGAKAKCLFSQTFAFVGSGRNHALAVWLAAGGSAEKLSTRAVDDMLAAETNPAAIQLETRVSRHEERLYIHMSDRTLVYLRIASIEAQTPVWYVARSGRGADKAYRPRNAILAYNKWFVGDTETAAIGVLDEGVAEHFGEAVGWRFDTRLLYNAAKSGIIHSLELVGLPGRGATVSNPYISVSYTLDGETWSVPRANRVGANGERAKRITWNPHLRFRNYLGLRFAGDSSALSGWAALEAEVEGLAA
jgi:hypothetical protein